MQAQAAAMIETGLVRSFLSCVMPCFLPSLSPLAAQPISPSPFFERETLIHQPLPNHVGDDIIVLVHHDHMRVSPDAQAGDIAHVDLPASAAPRPALFPLELP